jgi:trimethylamine--corrinoid protein Co-methyltransferase
MNVSATEETLGRRRGSPRAARSDDEAPGVPYIVRNIPSYEILSEENLLRIEATADGILAQVGIEFRDDPAAIDHWKRAGAKVDGLRVTFEPGMLKEIVASAPSQFTQYARNPSNNVLIGGNSVVFSPAYGSPFVMDQDRGRRYGTIEDFRNLIKVVLSAR